MVGKGEESILDKWKHCLMKFMATNPSVVRPYSTLTRINTRVAPSSYWSMAKLSPGKPQLGNSAKKEIPMVSSSQWMYNDDNLLEYGKLDSQDM